MRPEKFKMLLSESCIFAAFLQSVKLVGHIRWDMPVNLYEF